VNGAAAQQFLDRIYRIDMIFRITSKDARWVDPKRTALVASRILSCPSG
jgi:hypothetical protein